jgi:biopolymer transport protein ExbB
MPQTGLMHFWVQGDAITHSTALVLLLLSVGCWYVILGKLAEHLRYRLSEPRVLSGFWDADSLAVAMERLRRADRTGAFTDLAEAGLLAAQAHQRQLSRGPAAGIDANEFIRQSLWQARLQAQARMERGLTFLASVGATAPFIGLFGTVWGIYHALVGLSGATQVVLEKVAGPVGEALIMTAAGLFVAIPAVLAYNACVRANRLLLARLDGFAHGLHAYLAAGIRPHAQDETQDMQEISRAAFAARA